MHRDISRQTSVARQQQLAQSKPSRSGGPCFFLFSDYNSSARVIHSLARSDVQKHFRCTICGPLSSYSSFEIHISWNVLSEDRIEPPIHTEYLRSGGATIFTLIEAGARAVISLVRRTSMFGNIVVPPLSTVFVYKSRRISTSHFMIDSYASLWMPSLSLPIRVGLKSTSGQRKRSAPTVIT